MTEKWIVIYEGPPIKPPFEDFKEHLSSFLKESLSGIWVPTLAIITLLGFTTACLFFTKPELIPEIINLMTVFGCSFAYGVYFAIGILWELSKHYEYCSVPPMICKLERTKCYVKRCPHYKNGFCVRGS